MVVFCLVPQLGRGELRRTFISCMLSVSLINGEISHATLQDHSGIFGRGAKDRKEGVEDPKDQGQGLQELDIIAIGILPPCLILSNLFQYEIFSWV